MATIADRPAIDFDPYSLSFHENPYPVYKQLRDEAPVYFHEKLNFYAISRYADVVEAHKDDLTYCSSGGVQIEPSPPGETFALIMKDNPEHRWAKAAVTKVFTRSRMENMEGFVRALCVDLLEKAAAKEEFDFVNDFAVQLPLTVISELIGIPEEYRQSLHHFANMLLLRGEVDPIEIYKSKIAADETYAELIRLRRASPRDDAFSLLINTEMVDDKGVSRLLTDEELAGRLGELAIAGHETVSKAIPNGAVALQTFLSERKKLIADPSLCANASEEVLRFDPPSQLQGRMSTRDVELHGVTIPKDSRVMLLTGAATRDERKYENPDIFDVSRKNDLASIYFGFGIHKCLGIHLARLEIRVALEEMMKRIPNYEVFPDKSTRVVLSNVRGYGTLPCNPGQRP